MLKLECRSLKLFIVFVFNYCDAKLMIKDIKVNLKWAIFCNEIKFIHSYFELGIAIKGS